MPAARFSHYDLEVARDSYFEARFWWATPKSPMDSQLRKTEQFCSCVGLRVDRILVMDYSCDEKKYTVGATFWYHCVAEDCRIPKMPAMNPLQALVHPQTQKKKTILHGLSIPNPNFSEFAFNSL
jgi:hypothetical protein